MSQEGGAINFQSMFGRCCLGESEIMNNRAFDYAAVGGDVFTTGGGMVPSAAHFAMSCRGFHRF